MTALKGINLGGWLVLERWITPTLFQGTTAMTERGLTAEKGGKTRIRKHHKTFITEKDIAWLADNDFELLRVPIGYWILGEDPEFVGSIERLDWLMDMAHRYGMKVLIDLHGAPGAQNDKQHNGGILSKGEWLNDRHNQTKTIELLETLAKRYYNDEALWGIEMLNEPSTGKAGLRLARFYRRAYKSLTKVARPNMHIVFSDGLNPLLMANTVGWFAHPDFPVVMDTHIYYVFGKRNKQRSLKQHMRIAKYSRWLVKALSVFQPVMIGEWSAVLPYGVSIERTAEFATTQVNAYDGAIAQCYWTYKTEGSGRWDYRKSFSG